MIIKVVRDEKVEDWNAYQLMRNMTEAAFALADSDGYTLFKEAGLRRGRRSASLLDRVGLRAAAYSRLPRRRKTCNWAAVLKCRRTVVVIRLATTRSVPGHVNRCGGYSKLIGRPRSSELANRLIWKRSAWSDRWTEGNEGAAAALVNYYLEILSKAKLPQTFLLHVFFEVLANILLKNWKGTESRVSACKLFHKNYNYGFHLK